MKNGVLRVALVLMVIFGTSGFSAYDLIKTLAHSEMPGEMKVIPIPVDVTKIGDTLLAVRKRDLPQTHYQRSSPSVRHHRRADAARTGRVPQLDLNL